MLQNHLLSSNVISQIMVTVLFHAYLGMTSPPFFVHQYFNMAVRVSYHLRLSYMSLIENSLSYIWKYFTIPPILFKVLVAICSIFT